MRRIILFCAIIPAMILFTTKMYGQIYNINAGGIVSTCSGNFYDSGGSAGGYGRGLNYKMTFSSVSASDHIRFTFNSFALGAGDYLAVYDGDSTSTNLIASYIGTTSPGTITSAGNSLTFVFASDAVRYTEGAGWDASISCVPYAAMAYSSSTVTHPLLTDVTPVSNTQILQIAVVTTDSISPVSANSFSFNTNGSTLPKDIKNAKLWYTGTSGTFATTTQFGNTVIAPNGNFTITGSQKLQKLHFLTTNYFWLTYDIDSSAIGGDVIDAECTEIVVSGASKIPLVTAPTGNRTIVYNIRYGGSYTTCSGTFYDNSGSSGSYGRGINSTITFNSRSASDHIRFTFNSFSLGGGDYLYVYDGDSDSSTLIGTYSGTLSPGVITSVKNSLTFKFTTNTVRYTESTGWDASISCVPSAPMVYSSSTTGQSILSEVTPSVNTHILQVEIVTSDSISPISVTSFTFNTNGSTSSSDIKNAKLWSTGTNNTFTNPKQFGNTVSFPEGTFIITGSQVLEKLDFLTTNYFWLTYDVDPSASGGDVIDAECTEIVVDDTVRTPLVKAPAGSRTLIYNIGAGGKYTTCSGKFYDTGGSANNYGRGINTTMTLCARSSSDSIRVSFNSFSLGGGDFLNIYNGNSITSPLVGKYGGVVSPGIVTSAGNCLTFNFTTNTVRYTEGPGWDADISCVGNTPYATVRTSGSTSFCEGDSVTLISDVADTYLWSDNISTTRKIVVKKSGDYTVTTTTSRGKATSDATKVTAFSPPAIPVVTAIADTLMSGDTTGNQWYINGKAISGANQQTYVVNKSGTYSVQLTDTNGCSSVSMGFIHKLSTCTKPVVTLTGNTVSTTALGTYQWIDCSNDATIANETSQSYTAIATGSYKVTVTDSVCIDTSTCVEITIPTIGIQQQAIADGFILYPNPGNGKFTISSSNSTIQTIEVYNILGKLIWNTHVAGREMLIDISEQPKGIYFYRINSENNTVKAGKLIIE